MPPAFTGSKPYISSTMLSNVAGIFKDTIGCWNMSVCSHCYMQIVVYPTSMLSPTWPFRMYFVLVLFVFRAGGLPAAAQLACLCQELVPVPGACTCAKSMYLCQELVPVS